MPRRVSLPGADELFRPTSDTLASGLRPGPEKHSPEKHSPEKPGRETGSVTGRVRHDEKITVYVSRDELVALESARLTLRSHGITADRGRVVREAIAIALADLDANPADSALLARLSR